MVDFMASILSLTLDPLTPIDTLNEQVAYKRGVAGPKKWRPELIIVKMAV